MFLPVEAYIYNEDDGLYYLYEVDINPEHIEYIMPDDSIGENYAYVAFVSGQEMIIAMSVDEFNTMVTYSQIRTLLS